MSMAEETLNRPFYEGRGLQEGVPSVPSSEPQCPPENEEAPLSAALSSEGTTENTRGLSPRCSGQQSQGVLEGTTLDLFQEKIKKQDSS